MEEKQMVVFKLGDGDYAVDILNVKEIIRYRKTVKVPDAPHFIEGIINYRDSVVPIIDLNSRFELGSGEVTDATRVIIVSIRDKQIGFMVDQVEEVLRMPGESIEDTPEEIINIDRQYIRGIGKINGRLIIILDAGRVLTQGERNALDRIS